MNDIYDRFETYINGESDEAERLDLERQLAEDPALRGQLESYRALRRHYQDQWAHEKRAETLHKTMAGLRTEFFPPPPRRRKLRVWWFVGPAAAAACALILVLLQPQPDLFQQYYRRPPSAFGEKSYNDDRLLQQAGQAYNEGRFEIALPLLDSLLRLYPNAAQVRFYKAISLLESGSADQARDELESLAKGPSAYAEDAQWFLALSWLKDGNHEACRQALKDIPQTGRWSEQSALLKKKLNKDQ
jgi:tetratricopeptide (TPR) repeat protein